MAEFFNLAEVPLNRDGEAWGNLGYWEFATQYSEACRELATLLGSACELNADSAVLDAGFGCGDQLLHWLEHFGVQCITGVNLSQSQTEFARTRMLASAYAPAVATLQQGNINDPGVWDSLAGHGINRVVALDCAYHFPDRSDFIERSGGLLPEGGRLGLTDFVLAEPHRGRSFRGAALASMLRASRIPSQNLVQLPRYVEQLEDAGFREVQSRDISEWVMPSFGQWLRSFKRTHRWRMPRSRWLKYEVTGAFLDWAYRRQVLRYVMISAVR